MNSDPYAPPTAADIPAKEHLPVSVTEVLGICFAALLELVYLSVASMATYESIRAPPYGSSGYVQIGAISALFAIICLNGRD